MEDKVRLIENERTLQDKIKQMEAQVRSLEQEKLDTQMRVETLLKENAKLQQLQEGKDRQQHVDSLELHRLETENGQFKKLLEEKSRQVEAQEIKLHNER